MKTAEKANPRYRRPEWQFAFLLAAILLGFCAFTQFNGHFGQDANEYFRFSGEVRRWMDGGEQPGPFFWPLFYPYLGAVLSYILRDVAFALQFVSIISQCLMVPVAAAMIRTLFPDSDRRETALYAFLFVGLSPFMLRSSLLTMTDSISILLTGLATLQSVRYFKMPSGRTLIYAGIWAGLAGAARYNSLFLLAVPALMVGWRVMKSGRWLDLIVPILLAVGLIAPELLLHERPEGLYSAADLWQDISPLTWFQSSYPTHEGVLSYSIPNGVYMFMPFYHPGYFFPAIGLLGIVLWKKLWKGNAGAKWVFGMAIFYLMFTGMVHMQINRLLVPAVSYLAIALFPGFVWLWGIMRKNALKFAVVGVIFLAQAVFAVRSFQAIWKYNGLERELVAAMGDMGGKKVYTFGLETAFAAYGVPCEVESLWYREIRDAQKGEFLLLNKAAIEQQFAGYPPMKNWDIFHTQFSVDTVRTYREGWVLYEFR